MLLGGAAAGAGSGRAPLPSAEAVAGWLRWNEGRLCRDLIDACLDEMGNALFELPEYKVSNLKCRRVPEKRAACSFTSEEYGRSGSLKHCTATFKPRRLDNGKTDWELDYYPRRRRLELSPSPILTCN
jgi:hypothetical protein